MDIDFIIYLWNRKLLKFIFDIVIFRETYQTCTKLFVGMACTKKSHGRTDQQQPPSPPPPSEGTSSQARSRKSKDVPRTASRHPEYIQRLEHNRTRSMVVERGIDFQELAGTSFVIEVQRRRWETYCTVRNQANVTVVQEFYASMRSYDFLEGSPVKVRGKQVRFTAEEQAGGSRTEPGTSSAAPLPQSTTTPAEAFECVPRWGRKLTSIVKDLLAEFRAFRDRFGDEGTSSEEEIHSRDCVIFR